MQKQAYTVNELTIEIGIGRSKLYAEIKAGKLTPRKIGKKTIFLANDVERSRGLGDVYKRQSIHRK